MSYLFIFIASLGTVIYTLFYISQFISITDMEKMPYLKYTLVLGAGLERDNIPSNILMDRLKSAYQLLEKNKTEILILSGSTKGNDYCESIAMLNFLIEMGVKKENIEIDKKGNSTMASLVNFKNTHNTTDVVIVSQGFHIPRSLLLARLLKLKAIGYVANNAHFSFIKILYWYCREIIAIPYNFIKYLLTKLKGQIPGPS